MRLLKLLEETDDWKEEAWSFLKRDCSEYLGFNKRVHRCLYRGTRKTVGNFMKFIPKKDRQPKDIPIEVHNKFDKLFYEEFGWRPRSEGVFVTSDTTDAQVYGMPYFFFPFDRYDYIWSPKIRDLYNSLADMAAYENLTDVRHLSDFKIKNVADTYLECRLQKAIDMEREVMFKCDAYYLSKYSFVDYIQKDKDL